jgi:mannosyltransferase
MKRPAAWLVHTAEENSLLTTAILQIPVQAVTANADRTAEYFRRHGKPTVLAYPGIDPAKLERRMDEPSLRAKYQVAEDAPIVCMVSRLQAFKGHSDFLQAAVRVLDRFPTAIFFVVGEALFGMELEYARSLRQEARRLGIEGSVRFTGFIPDEELYGLMAASTMLVHPAKSEDFGIVIAEAQALGKPVVAYRTSGPELILEDGKTGYLVPSGDTDELVSRICKLLAEPERAQQMGQAGRQRVLERFSVQASVGVFQSVYTALANRG